MHMVPALLDEAVQTLAGSLTKHFNNNNIYLFIHLLICSFVHSFNIFCGYDIIHSFICLTFIHSFIHSFVHSFVHSLIRSFVHSFIYLFIFIVLFIAQ